MPKKHKWHRIDEITEKERQELEIICQTTKGLTLYGNRARTAVMLPLSIARKISEQAEEKNLSVSEVIIRILEQK